MSDVWQSDNGQVTLYHGDCLEVLPTLADNSVDAVVTDPPYGVGIAYAQYEDSEANLRVLLEGFLPQCRRIAAVTLITCGVSNLHLYPKPTWIMSWFSPNSNSRGPWGWSCWQPILTYGRCPYLKSRLGARPDAFEYSRLERAFDGHPCPKPEGIMRWIVRRATIEGDATVLDPFMGSGTTGVACVQMGRRFIGIEISEEYFEIAKRRIEAALMQPPLF